MHSDWYYTFAFSLSCIAMMTQWPCTRWQHNSEFGKSSHSYAIMAL